MCYDTVASPKGNQPAPAFTLRGKHFRARQDRFKRKTKKTSRGKLGSGETPHQLVQFCFAGGRQAVDQTLIKLLQSTLHLTSVGGGGVLLLTTGCQHRCILHCICDSGCFGIVELCGVGQQPPGLAHNVCPFATIHCSILAQTRRTPQKR